MGGADRVQALLGLRDGLAEAAEYAGRERGSVNGVIASGRPATPVHVQAVGSL